MKVAYLKIIKPIEMRMNLEHSTNTAITFKPRLQVTRDNMR